MINHIKVIPCHDDSTKIQVELTSKVGDETFTHVVIVDHPEAVCYAGFDKNTDGLSFTIEV
jgi:hypothetical protein